MYKKVKVNGKDYYCYTIPQNLYLPPNSSDRTRLFGKSIDELDEKVSILNKELDCARIRAVSLSDNFSDLFTVYQNEYFPKRERQMLQYHNTLFKHFKEYPDTKEVYIAFFQKIGRGRSKQALTKIYELMKEVLALGVKYGYKSSFPDAELSQLIKDHKSDHEPQYTKEDYDLILTELQDHERSGYTYGSASFILPFLIDVCIGMEEIMRAKWNDLYYDGNTVCIRFNALKKHHDLTKGEHTYIIPSELFDRLRSLNSKRYDITDLRSLPQNDCIFTEAPDKAFFIRRIHRLLIRCALPDDIKITRLAAILRDIKNTP